jgi:hypothetical protein
MLPLSVEAPFTFVLFLMPKYTFVCAPRFTPLQVTVAPEPMVAVPLVEQLPPPGSVYTGPPVRMRAGAFEAIAKNASAPSRTTGTLCFRRTPRNELAQIGSTTESAAVFPLYRRTNVMRDASP